MPGSRWPTSTGSSPTAPSVSVPSRWPSTSGCTCSYADSTEIGGSSYVAHVGHAATAIAEGKCSIALVSLAGIASALTGAVAPRPRVPEGPFENNWGLIGPVSNYAIAARRHMYEFGTTSAQLAEIKVAASLHAQHNPNALLQNPVTVEEVLDSPMIADPLHRLDCCVVTDGGGAVVVTSPEVARDLAAPQRQGARSRRSAEAHRQRARRPHVHAARRGRARVPSPKRESTPGDIDYASIYDSFTITVLECDRRPRLLREGEGRHLRARRRARRARRPAARSTPTAAGCATTTPATGAA